ncbi:YceI family protein [Christiangramia sp. OXR-203]|jgi:polyisoprenoid-binding protein YceI|uniref:YceI family protein n=1 Tax=Christiangramia sp. OXR-203 TaxID=3100176 RepID=UPI002AC8AE04|nr:YceI family protein [Christiangramia sp. OXR-203]WPY98682.1 YceI family protein [Christiangramia sp. OXR-203]
MRPYQTIKMFTALLLISLGVNAQSYQLNNRASTLFINGTSNIHDWTIEAENTSGLLITEFDDGSLEDIEQLELNVIAESLVSGKSGMDKNTYKALNTNKFKEINFKLKKVDHIEKLSNNTYNVKATGNLMIAGSKKDIQLQFSLKADSNKLLLSGLHEINMTNFGIEAPTAMFGTIKTGDKVTIKFETQFNK